MKQEMSVWQWHQLDHKSFAPRSRQITTPVPHNSLRRTGWMLFPTRNQQCQITDMVDVYTGKKEIIAPSPTSLWSFIRQN